VKVQEWWKNSGRSFADTWWHLHPRWAHTTF